MLKSRAKQQTCVCIVGVGYVGESLLREFGKSVSAIGFDISSDRIRILEAAFKSLNRVELTTNPAAIARATHIFIAVPTLLKDDRSISLDCVIQAVETVLTHAQPGSCIVIESSVPVGTTRKLLGRHQHEFHCGMSPERIDPGRLSPTPSQIPKLISALTPSALKEILSIYSLVYEDVRPLSKPEVAEMTKLFENCYRMVNIAYVNEISDACSAHGIDPREMIEAAATKPFGFQAFYPGLGVGGHCIPVNPYYLFTNNKYLPVLDRATRLMANRPRKLARRFHKRCLESMSHGRSPWRGKMPRILLVGIGFKAGQSDVSGSPALAFAQELQATGCARLAFYDQMVHQRPLPWLEKLHDSYWTAAYIESKFDGLYICNHQTKTDLSLTKSLKQTVIGSYVPV